MLGSVLKYFSFQPVLHDLCNKDRSMCCPVCGMVHIKEPLLLIGKNSPCGGSGFPLSLSEWSFTICPTPYNRKIKCTGVGSGGGGGGGRGGHVIGGGGQWYVCAPPLLTPHFYFPLELYVYITLTNNYWAFFIYQLIILWTISINWHRWMLLNNHTSKYNSFILVLYRRYKNHVSVTPPPPPFLATFPSFQS